MKTIIIHNPKITGYYDTRAEPFCGEWCGTKSRPQKQGKNSI